MLENLTETDMSATQQVVEQMVEIAESIAGGSLATLHERAPVRGLEARIKEVVAPLCLKVLRQMAGEDAYVQGVPNIRVHRPFDLNSVVPFHSDVLYGHSPEETNYWVNLTPAYDSNSLWMAGEDETEFLHRALKHERLSLAEFEELARRNAVPIEAPAPGVHPFCCARVHGSILNETPHTRVSFDLRALGPGARSNVKRRGGYFRPQWLDDSASACPLETGTVATTVASLDVQTPLYLQRMAMERFYPQGAHPELVEFHGLEFHSPTLTDAMLRGPVVAYTIRQLREVPRLSYPIGFVDENVWITPERIELLERLFKETGGK